MEYIPVLVLVLSFVALLAIGTPVAWSIAISSVLTMLVSIPALPAFTTVSQRMGTGLDSFALLAIPFFVLSGQLMNKGGIAHRLIAFAKTLVGSLPGGLALINVIGAMLMGAIAGSAMASASAMGSILGPEMEKEGYSKEFGAAVNITSSTTGLIIPPSNVLIVYSLASGGVSIAALFLAGYIPGILTGLLLMIVASFWAKKKNYKRGERSSLRQVFKTFIDAVPSLFLLVVVIGGIVTGIFTATEASAIAVLYTMVLGFIYKEITFKNLPEILLESSITTAIVMLLIGASMTMSWVMSYENIPQDISSALLGVSDNPIIILLIINLLLLFVGIFMDMTPAVLIFTPIFLPVVTKLGMDPVQFGIIMVLNLCIGLCTPPVGSVLFVGVGVAKTTIQKVIKPLIPLFLAMIFALFLVTFFPELTLWLPRLFDL
ncbi:TRAP-type C4-dicarboxylate transport system, large permease component [Formosa agariphila KMM 3901]|uniref:TRAP-type C4-dicarboxylate transport system, large permease component n=1 Tax=Formosa agariphila (strain DSM 15362 / KCTC 12365 / LMG 23005 / KMM 3901 / M-2Alg 35-1) TaxID=1347342 RepID=T2KL24_FORAG|nr:TRAP transporter large permease [Formosa agariphila]CDF78699.1 TRAP-type C4-dicarboxylate transport system, large permease component [Formosa agariphila KMM 3901]